MRIQAYRRKTATPVDTGFNHVEFKPNDAGDVVADVDDDGDIAVLLSIPEAYCEYAPAEAEKPTAAKTSKGCGAGGQHRRRGFEPARRFAKVHPEKRR